MSWNSAVSCSFCVPRSTHSSILLNWLAMLTVFPIPCAHTLEVYKGEWCLTTAPCPHFSSEVRIKPRAWHLLGKHWAKSPTPRFWSLKAATLSGDSSVLQSTYSFNLSLALKAHVRQLITTSNSRSRGSNTLFLYRNLNLHAHAHKFPQDTYTQI